MMPAWFARMNQRERLLSLAVGGVLFLLVNLAIWSALFGMSGGARTELAKRKEARNLQKVYVKEYKMWEARDKWLRAHQPPLTSPAENSTLLDQVKQIAGKNNVLIENPQLGTGDSTAAYRSVFASIETKSPWPPLVHFLYDVQKPEAFVVFENVNLMIDSGDPTVMRGKFKIAKWLEPAPRK
jgi:hypothetical protein